MNNIELVRSISERLLNAIEGREGKDEPIRETIYNLNNDTLNPMRVSRVLEAALILFKDDSAKAVTWCFKPARFLSGSTPMSMVDSDCDVQKVLDSIEKLQHGIPL